jgi:hypothetical protein
VFELQQKLTAMASTFEDLKALHHMQLAKLDALFASLHQHAFCGDW